MAGWQDGAVDMAAQATATTMRIIADALFAGDERLTTEAAMDHITAALDGVSEARLQALLGLPLMPWSLKGKRAQARPEFPARDAWARWCATAAAGRRARRFPRRPDPRAQRQVRRRTRRFALAVDNAATFYLAGHETTANALDLDAVPARRAAGAAGRGRAARPRRRWRRARRIRACPSGCPCFAAILEESMRLYPPVPRFDRQAAAADRLGDHEVEAGDIVSIWPWLHPPPPRALGRSRRLRSGPLAARGESGAAPLPISPLRRRPAPVRRHALRHDRGAGRARPLAALMVVRADAGARGPALGHDHPAARGRPAADPGAALLKSSSAQLRPGNKLLERTRNPR